MNVLFNNPMLYVIDYPGHDALEIMDSAVAGWAYCVGRRQTACAANSANF